MGRVFRDDRTQGATHRLACRHSCEERGESAFGLSQGVFPGSGPVRESTFWVVWAGGRKALGRPFDGRTKAGPLGRFSRRDCERTEKHARSITSCLFAEEPAD